MPADVDHYRRLLRYDAWANSEALRSMEKTGAPPPKAVGWLAHIIGAEKLWLSRLLETPTEYPVWPELDLAGCAAALVGLAREWPSYLGQLADADLADSVAYRNTKGELWTSTIGDILEHVVSHGAYHRGQIASGMRAAGLAPAYTDFIHAVRQGLVE